MQGKHLSKGATNGIGMARRRTGCTRGISHRRPHDTRTRIAARSSVQRRREHGAKFVADLSTGFGAHAGGRGVGPLPPVDVIINNAGPCTAHGS